MGRNRSREWAWLVPILAALAAALAGCGSGGGPQFTSAVFVRSIAIGGSGSHPLDVIADFNSSLYAMAANSWQVKKYTPTGVFLEDIIPFFAVTAGAFDANNNIFVVSPGVGRVAAFDLAGNERLDLEINLPSGTKAYGVAVNNAGQVYVWVIDELASPPVWRILRFTGSTSEVFVQGGPTVLIPVGQQQRGIDIDEEGVVYYADSDADRIRILDPLTMQGRSIGTSGARPGQLNDPRDVAVDHRGDIYVADTGNHRVQKFDRDGTFLFIVGAGQGTALGQFQAPQGVAVIATDEIVVADTDNDRVQVFAQF